jgi:hypothetical protein
MRKLHASSLLFAVAITAAAQSAKPALFDRNLLKNPNIELPITDPNKVPGWTDAKGLQQAVYGSVSGEWDWGLTGCTGCGKQYIRLDFEGTVHELSTSQTIDVASAADAIDKGKVTAATQAWLGAFHGADTTSTIDLSYQDAAGKELGKLATTPVDTNSLPKAQSGDTGLVLCQTKGAVPAGTRKILFTWHAKSTGESGQYLALGDNFSLVLTAPQN